MADETKGLRPGTLAIHAGQERFDGAVATPIFQSSTFESRNVTAYHQIKYIRLNNTPNHRVLHARLAALEGGEAALVTSSGMAAISTALLTVLKAGDHVLAELGCYGGTDSFFRHELPRCGVSVDFFDGTADPSSWPLRENTRAIYCETLTNPLLRVIPLETVVAFARAHGLVSLVDNTFATPLEVRPLELGVDLVLHSATKYLNGHSDIVAGAVVGSADHILAVTKRLNHYGGSLDPHACYLLERGMKTLPLRWKQQCASAAAIAQWLRSRVETVHYPDIGGVVAFEMTSVEAADALLDGLRLFLVAPSLGGVESLAIRPAATTTLNMTPQEREAAGIRETLVRLAVGCEHTQDLLDDLERAWGSSG